MSSARIRDIPSEGWKDIKDGWYGGVPPKEQLPGGITFEGDSGL